MSRTLKKEKRLIFSGVQIPSLEIYFLDKATLNALYNLKSNNKENVLNKFCL